MTYPDPAVAAAIRERFVPLRLDLFADRRTVRPLNVIWTPTILIADRRGVEHYRSINFLPPADFLDILDLGEASTRLRWGEHEQSIELLASIPDRHPDGALVPEAIYWRGIATYLQRRDHEALSAIWQELTDRFPDSIWTRRIP